LLELKDLSGLQSVQLLLLAQLFVERIDRLLEMALVSTELELIF
jgi:hypothetical protein